MSNRLIDKMRDLAREQGILKPLAVSICAGTLVLCFGTLAWTIQIIYQYGSDNAAEVLTTAPAPGTYDATSLAVGTVKNGTGFGVSQTGTLTPDGGAAGTADLFNGKTAHLTADWTLDTGTLDLACNTATFDGTANKVADAYDGGGNGLNRWCITDSGNAAAATIRSGNSAWVDGVAVSGSMGNCANGGANCYANGGKWASGDCTTGGNSCYANASYWTGSACGADNGGTCYINAGSKSAVDGDLAAGNIKSGVNIFGITGNVAAESHSNCTGGNQTGCVATASWKTTEAGCGQGSTAATGPAYADYCDNDHDGTVDEPHYDGQNMNANPEASVGCSGRVSRYDAGGTQWCIETYGAGWEEGPNSVWESCSGNVCRWTGSDWTNFDPCPTGWMWADLECVLPTAFFD